MAPRYVQVLNETRDHVLAEKAELAGNVWKLLVGLIPYRTLDEGGGMVFPRTGSIHTTFLRFPIDVMFLNRTGRVVGMRSQIRPFRIAWAPRGVYAAVELPVGILESAGCQLGDQVTIRTAEDARPGP